MGLAMGVLVYLLAYTLMNFGAFATPETIMERVATATMFGGGTLAREDDRVVGEGWHEGPGTPHAEAMALAVSAARRGGRSGRRAEWPSRRREPSRRSGCD